MYVWVCVYVCMFILHGSPWVSFWHIIRNFLSTCICIFGNMGSLMDRALIFLFIFLYVHLSDSSFISLSLCHLFSSSLLLYVYLYLSNWSILKFLFLNWNMDVLGDFLWKQTNKHQANSLLLFYKTISI